MHFSVNFLWLSLRLATVHADKKEASSGEREAPSPSGQAFKTDQTGLRGLNRATEVNRQEMRKGGGGQEGQILG